ncbi:hypothetical protein, partial [Pararhodobacter sp.]
RRHACLLLLDHPDNLRLGETAFPHVVCSFRVEQTLHHGEGFCGGQVKPSVRAAIKSATSIKNLYDSAPAQNYHL